jgi:hypothetical protein
LQGAGLEQGFLAFELNDLSARDWASGGYSRADLSTAVFSMQIRRGRVGDRAAEHAHRKSRERDEEEMKCLDNSRSRAQHVTHTLKRVYGKKGRRTRPLLGGQAQSTMLLITWVLSSGSVTV